MLLRTKDDWSTGYTGWKGNYMSSVSMGSCKKSLLNRLVSLKSSNRLSTVSKLKMNSTNHESQLIFFL